MKPKETWVFLWHKYSMANKFTRYLTDAVTGFVSGVTHPKGLVSNWRHATRMFIDDTYRLAPRSRFLFYVKFELDKTSYNAPSFTARHADEVGMLVKSSDLPKFTVEMTSKNQYNRKKLVQTAISYDPITIKFHDDSDGVTNALWAIYYGYYSADRHNTDVAFEANHYRPTKTAKDNYRYGLDNNITSPMFKSISIYTMSRQRFLGYTLINPRIKKWEHGTMDHAANEMLESSMTLEYESVRYSGGTVSQDNPKGFATLHYDTMPSPLSVAGGGTKTLTGSGGVLAGITEIFGDVASGNTFDSLGGLVSTAVKAINTYNNASSLTVKKVIKEEVGIITNPGLVNTAISGIIGATFPNSTLTSTTTTATQKSLVGKK